MDDNIPKPPPVPDDLGNAADEATQKLEGVTDGVANLGDNLTQGLEDGLNAAEEKVNVVTSWLDKFLGKS
jgi:hypothetical protein